MVRHQKKIRYFYMFREMRRFKQQVSQDECKKILKDEKRAAFSVIGDEVFGDAFQLIFTMKRLIIRFIFMEPEKATRWMQSRNVIKCV